MKAALTFFLVISLGTISFAQQPTEETKVATSFVKVEKNNIMELDTAEVKKNDLARVYMFKNSRIKKALAFRTKRNRSKIA